MEGVFSNGDRRVEANWQRDSILTYSNCEFTGDWLVVANRVRGMASIWGLFRFELDILVLGFWGFVEDAIAPGWTSSGMSENCCCLFQRIADHHTYFMSYSDVPGSNLNVGGKAGKRSSSWVKARPWSRTNVNWSFKISSSSLSCFTKSRISSGVVVASSVSRKFKSPNQKT